MGVVKYFVESLVISSSRLEKALEARFVVRLSQLELLRKYENFRSREVEINDDISSIEPLKMKSDTQEEAQERNILSSTPILKFIDEKDIDVLTVENENNLSTSQPKKALYQCQHCSKSYEKELPFAKHISKCSTPDDKTSPKDESMIGM